MSKYRKKPVVIEAREFTVKDMQEVAAWCEGEWRYENGDESKPYIAIRTLEGTMAADVGDFIIRGVKGEFYPCKPDIFAVTYEAVEELTPSRRGAYHPAPPVGLPSAPPPTPPSALQSMNEAFATGFRVGLRENNNRGVVADKEGVRDA